MHIYLNYPDSREVSHFVHISNYPDSKKINHFEVHAIFNLSSLHLNCSIVL